MAVIKKRFGSLLLVCIIVWSHVGDLRVDAASVRSARKAAEATTQPTTPPEKPVPQSALKDMFSKESVKKPTDANVPASTAQDEKKVEKPAEVVAAAVEQPKSMESPKTQENSSDAKSVPKKTTADEKTPADKSAANSTETKGDAKTSKDAPDAKTAPNTGESAAKLTGASTTKAPNFADKLADETQLAARDKLKPITTSTDKPNLTTVLPDVKKLNSSEQQAKAAGDAFKPKTEEESQKAAPLATTPANIPLENPADDADPQMPEDDEEKSTYADDSELPPPGTPPADGVKKETKEEGVKTKPADEPPKEPKTEEKEPVEPKEPTSKVKKPANLDIEQSENSHFMTYMIVCGVLVVVAYLAVHNKKKIIGLIVEGRSHPSSGRRGSHGGARYRRMDTQLNDEDAVPLKGSDRHNVIY